MLMQQQMFLPPELKMKNHFSHHHAQLPLRFVSNQCFLNAVVQCLSHTRGLRDYSLVKAYKHEKFSKEDAKLMEGVPLSPLHVPSLAHQHNVPLLCLKASLLPVPAFTQVLSGLWDVNEGDTVVNPRQFYSTFKEAVPYFSGYR